MMKRQVSSIHYSKSFEKSLRKIPRDVQRAWLKRLTMFIEDPFNPPLHNHSLSGKYTGYRSINITGDWRALYVEKPDNNEALIVLFKAIGTHSQLYR